VKLLLIQSVFLKVLLYINKGDLTPPKTVLTEYHRILTSSPSKYTIVIYFKYIFKSFFSLIKFLYFIRLSKTFLN